MVWHIFRKDWRLLWPIVVVMAIAYAINAWIWLVYGHFHEPRELGQIAYLYPALIYLGIGFVVVAAVHQDVIPGDRQDWLVRPVCRGHLLLAKILFLVLAVLAPLIVMDAGVAIVAGFPETDAVRSVLGRAGAILCLVIAPASALAAVTRNVMEAIIGGALAAVVSVALALVGQSFGLLPPPLAGSPGLTWAHPFAWAAIALVATAIVLLLQFRGRKTSQARLVCAAAILLGQGAIFQPWEPVFALEAWLLPNRDFSTLSVAFDPSMEKSTSHDTHDLDPQLAALTRYSGALQDGRVATISVPLRITGLPSGAVLYMDRADIRIADTNGNLVYHHAPYLSADGPGNSEGSRLRVRQGEESSDDVRTQQRIFLPSDVYTRLKDQPLSMEIRYALTLFARQPTAAIAAVGGDQRLENGAWWCKTKVDDDSDEIMVGCMTPDDIPDCVAGLLENSSNGQHNPELLSCRPNYSPLSGYFYPFVLARMAGSLQFHDPQGLAKYPVNETQLDKARVLLTPYKAEAHFTHRIVIPEIRLSDWVTPSPRSASP